MIKHPEPKTAVALIRKAFVANGSKVQTKVAYDLLAQLWGYNDWATYCATNPQSTKAARKSTPMNDPFARKIDELEGWQPWVVSCVDDDEADLVILPFGATVQNRLSKRGAWNLLNSDDAIPLTVGFTEPAIPREGWQDLVVATEVACMHPDSDRYGFPMYANEREVHLWLKDTLGWGYLASESGASKVDVIAKDSGDDSGGQWWVQLLVHPSVHARLLTQFEPQNVAFEHIWPELVLDHKPSSADPRALALLESLAIVFESSTAPMEELMEMLRRFPALASAQDMMNEHMQDYLIDLSPAYSALTVEELRAVLSDRIDAASRVTS